MENKPVRARFVAWDGVWYHNLWGDIVFVYGEGDWTIVIKYDEGHGLPFNYCHENFDKCEIEGVAQTDIRKKIEILGDLRGLLRTEIGIIDDETYVNRDYDEFIKERDRDPRSPYFQRRAKEIYEEGKAYQEVLREICLTKGWTLENGKYIRPARHPFIQRACDLMGKPNATRFDFHTYMANDFR